MPRPHRKVGSGLSPLWSNWRIPSGPTSMKGEAASSYFDAMRQSLRSDQFDQAIEHGKRLVGEYGKTTYASFAGLELAKLSYQRGEKAAARDHLSWVAESASEPVLRDLARLRLGHLLHDMGAYADLPGLLARSY